MNSIPRVPPLTTGAALLAALVGPPLFIVIPDRLFGEFPSLGIQIVLQLLYCALAGSILWVVLRVERLPLQSIGLRRPTWLTLLWGVALALATLYVLPLITRPLVNALGAEGFEAGVQRLARLPTWFRIVVGVAGGAVEETLYRGYAIERLTAITGRRWLGATIATVAFVLAHVPAWGLAYTLGANLPFGVVMTLFYLWRRDLLANILAHSTGLVVALLIAVP